MFTPDSPRAPIAVIGFSGKSSPLEPLWPSTHRALMPIAGKPLIVHLIEQIAEAGFQHIRIAGSIQQYAVRKRLGDGKEWGVTIRYSDLHGDDLRAECLAASGDCLYLLGDELHYADFISLRKRSSLEHLGPDIEESTVGLWRLRKGRLVGYSLELASGEPAYENGLNTVADYHFANMKAARGLLPRLNIPGKRLHQDAISDWKCSIADSASIGSSVFIGKHAKIGKLARLERDCSLSNGVIIDNGVRLANVTVLPNCFVGRQVCLRDAVLGIGGVFGLDGQFWPVDASRLLGATRESGEARTGIPSPNMAERWGPNR